MEENKNQVKENQQPAGEQGAPRRKRRRKRGGANRQNNQSAQNNQTPQNQKPSAQTEQTQKRANGNNGNNANKQQNKKQNGGQAQQKNQKPQNNQNNNQKEKNKGQKEENRKDTYAYTLDGNLYINLTNKCSNGCDFCVRNERSSYYGNYLWLKNGDPTVDKVIAAVKGFGDLSRFKEVVFCGFGEPTYKVAEMVALCDYFHGKGLSTRLNTNGQGNLINKRDIVPDLKGKIDFVNISLNASCAEKYQPICRSQFGIAGFEGLIEFAKLCKRNGINCRFSIVDCIGEEEVAACKCLADSVRIPLYVRKYIADS